jgi:ribonuclease P protein component
MRKSAPRLSRLTKRAQFQAAAGDGRRFRSSFFSVQVLDREAGQDGVRIGLTASRKTGNAIKRNRIRRRLRAAAREAYAGLTERLDIVAVARAETISAPYEDLVRTLRDAPKRARAQHRPRSSQQGSGDGPDVTAARETKRS